MVGNIYNFILLYFLRSGYILKNQVKLHMVTKNQETHIKYIKKLEHHLRLDPEKSFDLIP